MIKFERCRLDNGLRVIVHRDSATPFAAMNILYEVGARDEDPERTGFAHLFEHLMFGGSQNIPLYDRPLEEAGGENNAFTTNDITDYYLSIPAVNLERAFWLESDRMLGLALNATSLRVQKRVVIEEFRQSYLNQPYGDVWLLLRPLAYKVHPYRWPTIGKDISHIENARLSDVAGFFKKFYHPGNAILVVAGNVEYANVFALAEKWFGPIRAGKVFRKERPAEPLQSEPRFLEVKRKVPCHALFKAYHTCARTDPDFYAADLLSDILAEGKSARLYQSLVKEKALFSDIDAFLTGDMDKGLFVVTGKLVKGIKMARAEKALMEELRKISGRNPAAREVQKVKNKVESALLFSEINVMDKAMHLAAYEAMGDAEKINEEASRYRAVSGKDISRLAAETFREKNCSTLYYLAKKK